jgi:hypothetical protein
VRITDQTLNQSEGNPMKMLKHRSSARPLSAHLVWLLVGLGWLSQTACSDSCEDTQSCKPGDGDGDSDGDLGGAGPGDGDGDSGDGDSSSGDGDGDMSGGDGDSGDGDGPSCKSNEVACDGKCIDPTSDTDFCGASADCSREDAGSACEDDEVCDDGVCTVVCDEPLLACDGECIDPMTDEDFCGAAGTCQGRPDSGRKCESGEVCLMGDCHGWQAPERVSVLGTGEPSWVGIEVDKDGRALLAWTQVFDDGGSDKDGLFVSHSSSAGNWSATEMATSASDLSASRLTLGSLVTTAGGTGFLSVVSNDFRLWGLDVDTGGAYSAPESIRVDSSNFVATPNAISSSGAIMLATLGSFGTLYAAIRPTPSDAFEGTFLPDTSGLATAHPRTEAISDSQFLVVWEQGDAGSRSIGWARRSASGWYPQNPPLGDGSADFYAPELYSNGDGAAYLTWTQGSAQQIARYDMANDGFIPLSGHPSLAQASEVQVVVLANGDAIVLTAEGSSIAAQKYVAADDSWDELAAVEPSGSGAANTLLSQADDSGNLLLVYVQDKSSSGAALWGTRFDAANDSWSESVILHDGEVHSQDLAVVPNGDALVAWTASGQDEPYVARFQ